MLSLKPKQADAVQAVNDPSVDVLVLLGVVGSGKTGVAAHIVISICLKSPKTYWPAFRQSISTAIKTLIPSSLEMADKVNLVEGEGFVYNQQAKTITFQNKSVIVFVEADASKDRGGKKIKGINATGNHIDGPDEFEYRMFIQATSRRRRRNEAGRPSLSILTMNPNDGWSKGLFYDPWKAGTLPPNVRVIELILPTAGSRRVTSQPDDQARVVDSALALQQLKLCRRVELVV